MVPSTTSTAGMALAIVDWARSAPSLSVFKRAVLDVLAPIGFDVAIFETKMPSVDRTSTGMDARVSAACAPRWAIYERELAPVAREALRLGAATDGEVLGAARARTAYFTELVRPHGGTDSLLAPLMPAAAAGGAPLGGLVLGRAGSRFGARDLARVRAIVSSLAVGVAAVIAGEAQRQAGERVARAGVTPREREVLDLVCLGYTNGEIAGALGSSTNTVRNQVVSLLRKLGATTRAELVGVALGR